MLGARPLRRAIQHEVEDMLSEKILNGELSIGQHVLVDFVNDEFTAVMTGSILPPDEPIKGRTSKSAKVPADSSSDAATTDSGEDAPSE
jgi:ATP-dependent Clp protease ATP-binding subunit ClpC